MMESTFFYMGVVVFSMMILGLIITVMEFSRLSRAHDSKTNSQ